MKIVLDASSAAYLVVQRPSGDEIDSAAQVLRLVEEGEHELLIPAPALAEILVPVSSDRRIEVMARLDGLPNVRLRSFDLRAAEIAAGLTVKERTPRPWQLVKIDTQIVACAFRYAAQGICTLDGDLSRIAVRGPSRLTIGPPSQFLVQIPLGGSR